MSDRVKVYFDGGCRPNPGRMEYAYVIAGVAHAELDAGIGSSMDSEWLALIAALKGAQAVGLTDFVLLGDSVAVIDMANGRTKCRGDSVPHLAAFRALFADGAMPNLRYIKRTQNLAGIALERARAR